MYLWVEVQSHFIDTLQVWFVEQENIMVHYTLTRQHSIPDLQALRGWWHHYFLFPIPRHPEGRLYLQGYNPPPKVVKIPIVARSMPQLLHYLQADHWGWALFAGIMCMSCFLGAMGFLFYRQQIYLFYIGYILTLSVYALLNDGWGIYLPEWLSFLDDSTRIGHVLNLSFFLLMLFSKRFLMVTEWPAPQGSGKWQQFIHFYCKVPPLAIMLCFSGLLLVLHLMQQQGWYTTYQWTYRIGLACLPMYFVVWLAYIGDAIQRKFRAVWLLVGAVAILFFFYFYSLLVNLGWIAAWLSDMALLRMGVMADVAIIGVAWVYRQRLLDLDKTRLEQENMEKAREILQATERQQQHEIQRLRLLNEAHLQRERLARNLHDGIGSQFAHIISRLDMLEQRTARHTPASDPAQSQEAGELTEKLKSLGEFTRETNSMLRQTIWLLNQSELHYHELTERIRHWLYQVWDGKETPRLYTRFEGNPAQLLSPVLGFTALIVCKEAITNALKYAEATRIDLRIQLQEKDMVITVKDNGRGIEASQKTQQADVAHYGLHNLKRRCEEMAGKLELRSDRKGTQVICTLSTIEHEGQE
jgi:signal transduction histidine kinase